MSGVFGGTGTGQQRLRLHSVIEQAVFPDTFTHQALYAILCALEQHLQDHTHNTQILWLQLRVILFIHVI